MWTLEFLILFIITYIWNGIVILISAVINLLLTFVIGGIAVLVDAVIIGLATWLNAGLAIINATLAVVYGLPGLLGLPVPQVPYYKPASLTLIVKMMVVNPKYLLQNFTLMIGPYPAFDMIDVYIEFLSNYGQPSTPPLPALAVVHGPMPNRIIAAQIVPPLIASTLFTSLFMLLVLAMIMLVSGSCRNRIMNSPHLGIYTLLLMLATATVAILLREELEKALQIPSEIFLIIGVLCVVIFLLGVRRKWKGSGKQKSV